MTLNQQEIKKIIPHRDPFLLIDEINQLEPGVRAVGTKYLTSDEYWFRGHFPDNPVQPGVLMIEMLAQTGAVCILSLEENKGKVAYFAGIDKARFKKQVKPLDTLILEMEIIKIRGKIGIGKGFGLVNGQKVFSSQMTFAIGE